MNYFIKVRDTISKLITKISDSINNLLYSLKLLFIKLEVHIKKFSFYFKLNRINYFFLILITFILFSIVISFIPHRTFRLLLSSEMDLLKNMDVLLDKGPLKFHFIDSGQGDTTFIEYGGKNILIDTGPKCSALNLSSYLKGLTDRIDLVIISHGHDDHTGGINDIIKDFSIGLIALPYQEDEREIKTIKKLSIMNKIPIKYLEKGDKLEIDELKINILAPQYKYYENINNSSLVLSLQYKAISILLLGDHELTGDKIEGKKYNLIKAGHHGSSTSTDERFIKEFNPDLFIISCGLNNKFGHPSKSVMDLLKKYSIKNKRTDINGTICISTDGKNINYSSIWTTDINYLR